MVKYSKGQRKPNKKLVYLTENEQLIKWKEQFEKYDNKEVVNNHCIPLHSISEVMDYGDGPGFKKFAKHRVGKEQLGITIVGNRTLELDAASMEDKTVFIDCLRLAMKYAKDCKLTK